MFDQIQGLPAHPLIVHLPVIFGPVAGLFAVLLLIPQLRAKLLVPTLVMAFIFAAGTIFATESGEQLRNHLQDAAEIHDHAELGEMTRNIAIAFFLAMLVSWAAVKRGMTRAVLPLLVLAAVLGTAGLVWTVRTGHAGAAKAWDEVPGVTAPAGSGG